MAMLRHVYGSRYEKQELQVEDWQLPGFHLTIFMLGDKYDIGSLREEAAKRFKEFLEEEISDATFYVDTLYAVHRLLGPEAQQLADDSLNMSTRTLVLEYFETFFSDNTFRELLGSGSMSDEGLAHEFLNKIYKKKF